MVGAAVASIHRASDKAHSRKPISIHSHAYVVLGRMRAGLFSELPTRVLLGNWASGVPIPGNKGKGHKVGSMRGR